uniref:Uncharacterized protein n=2 Tax=Ditylum brightwellii TaxID=49249 RepID=A0A7S1YWF4_9STRA|mmetsp:Transcript_19096/g.28522  ORF Transcript_19096/g.28522 Transcript_19096/m.28522 type:complete len:218 (+) Transcript_19096:236-889(+)
MGFILKAISFCSGWLAVLIEGLCLMAGLYVLCDLAEEFASYAGKTLKVSLYTICILHLLLMIDGSLPFMNILFGIVAHVALVPLLQTFPYFEPISLKSFGALGVTLLNHFLWFRYFVGKNNDTSYYDHSYQVDVRREMMSSTRSIVGFFLLFIWMAPMGFFVSMTDLDDALPGGAGMGAQFESKRRKGFFKGLVDFVMRRDPQQQQQQQQRNNSVYY